MGNHISKTTVDGRTLVSINNSRFEVVPKDFAAFLDGRTDFCNIPGISGYQSTQLHRAARGRDVKLTEQLIDAGANVDAQDENGRTPLMRAIVSKDFRSFFNDSKADIITVLLNANANIHIRDKKGKSVWQMIRWRDAPIVQLLVKKLREQYTDSKCIAELLIEGDCPLPIAVLTKDAELVRLMLDHGCPVVDPVTNVSALSVAIYNRDARIVQLILEHGVDVHANDASGYAPKSWLAEIYQNDEQHLDILKLLLDHGAHEFNDAEEQEAMAIGRLLKTGDRRTISLLFQYLQDLSKKDGKGKTVLHYLACNTDADVLEEIRDKQFDVNRTDREGLAALHYSLGKPEWVEFLLDNGADVDAGEMTALFYAFWRRKYTPVRSVELLLRHGADPQARHDGCTIFEIPTVHVSHNRQQAMQPVVARLVMLESLGESIDGSIVKQIHENAHLTQRYGICNRQIERMKNRSLDGTVSLFTLLTADDKRFACYVRNREVMAKFEWIRRRFPAFSLDTYYYNILRERIDAMREVSALKEKLASVIFDISGFHCDAHHIIVDGIIRYFSVKELREFDVASTD